MGPNLSCINKPTEMRPTTEVKDAEYDTEIENANHRGLTAINTRTPCAQPCIWVEIVRRGCHNPTIDHTHTYIHGRSIFVDLGGVILDSLALI